MGAHFGFQPDEACFAGDLRIAIHNHFGSFSKLLDVPYIKGKSLNSVGSSSRPIIYRVLPSAAN